MTPTRSGNELKWLSDLFENARDLDVFQEKTFLPAAEAANLADLDPRSRHKIRIKAKKLRYIVEFFKTLPKIADKPKVLTRFLRCLEELQTRLGKIHDEEAKIAFLQGEVRNLSEEASHSAAFAAGILAGAPGDTSHELERSIEAYSQLAKANPFS